MADRYLIVGLGNPEPKYERTRHNIGFQCVDTLAHTYGLSFDTTKNRARIALGTIEGQSVVLAKPLTYMNLSGEAVGGLCRFYKIPPENVLVIFDDMDLPLGTLRIRKSGGTSGQKGMKSITQHLGTQDFPRIRFGIGRPPGRMDPAAYVLLPFKAEEESLVIETIDRAVKAIAYWFDHGLDNTMNRYNGSPEEVEQRLRAANPSPSTSSRNTLPPTEHAT